MFILIERSIELAYEGNSSELFWGSTQFRCKPERRLPQVPPYSTIQRNSGLGHERSHTILSISVFADAKYRRLNFKVVYRNLIYEIK
jgi:hypothetical protein